MMQFIRRRWRRILFLALPFAVGLILSMIAQLFLPTIFPILSSVDFGTAAFVFGMTIRNPTVVAFSFGFIATVVVLAVYFWDRRHIAQTQTMYADYLQEAGDRRRNFLRRLDHEIKNPLTGLRAALVNLTEEKKEEERQ